MSHASQPIQPVQAAGKSMKEQSENVWLTAVSRNYHIYAVIVLAFAFHALTIRGGHPWNGDFALNVLHAINIATGHPYTDTGYVYNPHDPLLAPGAYPPLFPLFLAPVYKLFGLDLHAMRVAGLLVFSVFLLVFHRYVLYRLDSRLAQFAAVTAMAFSPWVWAAKDQILPDFLFMLSTYTAVLFIDRRYMDAEQERGNYLPGAVTGLLVYLSYATRILGILLMPAVLILDMLKTRRIRRSSLVAVVVFAVLYLAQNLWIGSGQSYLDSFVDSLKNRPQSTSVSVQQGENVRRIEPGKVVRDTVARVIRHIDYYHQAISAYWTSGVSRIIDNALYLVSGLLALAGFIGLLRREGPSCGDVFLVLYVLVLLPVPFVQDRYLLPLIPLYLVYIFRGVEFVQASGYLPGRAWLAAGTLLVVITSYAGSYSLKNFGDFVNSVDKEQSTELFEFIRTQTPRDSLVVFRKPRILALYSGRRSMMYYWADDPFELRDFLVQAGATYVVLDKESSGIKDDDYLVDWSVRCAENLTPVFENSDFRVFRFSG